MSQSAALQLDIVNRENHLLSWFICIALTWSAMWTYRHFTQLRIWEAPIAMEGQASYFLLLKMPESPVDEPGQRAAASRLDHWLTHLEENGFHVLPLSVAHSRLAEGLGLPSRSVVLLYDPGYRFTYETFSPILERHRAPAAWLTSRDALDMADRRFVSYHELRRMKDSKWWDVALFSGVSSDAANARIFSWQPQLQGAWRLVEDRVALNFGDERSLHVLRVNPEWTGRQLTDRLLSEVPVTEPSNLTARWIKNRFWGVAHPLRENLSDQESAFSLSADRTQRSVTLEWPGTRGLHDMDVQFSVQGLAGDLVLILASDERQGDALHIGFGQDLVWVDALKAGEQIRLGSQPSPLKHADTHQVRVFWRGNHLTVLLNGKALFSMNDVPAVASKDGLMAVNVMHRVRGVAQARFSRFIVTPLVQHPGDSDGPRAL